MNWLDRMRLRLADNGLRWTALYLLHRAVQHTDYLLDARMGALEKAHGLPGENGRARCCEEWNNYDWRLSGEEWTNSADWKQSLIDDVLVRYVKSGQTVVEIGPGAGRWTTPLQRLAERLILVDISRRAIDECRKKFSHFDNVEFFVNDGQHLSFLQDESVDCIWSFDVFVHIAPADIEQYMAEFWRVLRPGGIGVIHHANTERRTFTGWRSRVTVELFNSFLDRNQLTLIRQFDSWGEAGQFNVRDHEDMITVFEKPRAAQPTGRAEPEGTISSVGTR